MATRLSESERVAWVGQWRASGLSCARFAALHGLSKATLYMWSHRVGRLPSSLKSSRVRSSPSSALTRVSSRRSSGGVRGGFTQVRVVGLTCLDSSDHALLESCLSVVSGHRNCHRQPSIYSRYHGVVAVAWSVGDVALTGRRARSTPKPKQDNNTIASTATMRRERSMRSDQAPLNRSMASAAFS